jgi:hypothetical protein
MSSGIWSELASHESTHIQMLEQLSVGQVDLFTKGFRSVRNFAIEDKKATTATQALSGSGTQELTFDLEGTLVGDFVNACHLEVQLPALTNDVISGSTTPTTLASWVWAVGFAMIDSTSVFIEGEEIEKLDGDYMELHDELHRKPGQMLQEAVFKYDRVTVPELAALSKTARTLYVPLPFFFTRGPHCVLPVGKHFDAMIGRTVKVQIQVQLRAIADIAIALPIDTLGASTAITVPKNDQGTALTWADIKVQLYVQQIYLEEAESQAMWMSSGSTGTYRAMCTTVQSLHGKSSTYPTLTGSSSDDYASSTIDRKKIPLRFPTKNIIFAVADKERTLTTITDHNDPYNGNKGVTLLHGARASHQANTTSGSEVWVTDWNTVKEGSKNLTTIDVVNGGTNNVVGSTAQGYLDAALPIRSTSDVKEWRVDGLAGSAFLPVNRFDYRAADNSGNEVEPIQSFSLKLNAQERVNTSLKPAYLRTIQTLAFNNQPRKGIYAYSFALDSSSPYPTGTVNLSRVHNRDLRIVANGHSSQGKELILYAENINIFEIANGKTAGRFAYSA